MIKLVLKASRKSKGVIRVGHADKCSVYCGIARLWNSSSSSVLWLNKFVCRRGNIGDIPPQPVLLSIDHWITVES